MAKLPDRKHEHPPKGMVMAADLLAGAVMPMKLTLNVTIRPGQGHGAAEDPDCPPRPHRPRVEDRLSQYTPEVLAWASRNRDNATLLLVDPKAAAARSGVKLSRTDLRALEQHVHSAGATEVLPPGVELVALNVRVAADEKPPREKEKKAKKNENKAARGKR